MTSPSLLFMITTHNNIRSLFFLDYTLVRMSAMVCVNSSSTHFNDHHPQNLYAYDHPYQHMIIQNNHNNSNIDEELLKTNQTILSSDLSEDQYCQICGDLASGWHCG